MARFHLREIFSEPIYAGDALADVLVSRQHPSNIEMELSNPYHDAHGLFTWGPDTGGTAGATAGAAGPSIEVRGDELGKHDDYKSLRKAADHHMRTLQGKAFVNEHTGREIRFSNSGRKKVGAAAGGDANNLKLVPAIPELIRHGKLRGTAAPAVPDKNLKALHRFDVPVKFEGKETTVNFAVREDANGHWYYNHAFGAVLPEPPPAKGK